MFEYRTSTIAVQPLATEDMAQAELSEVRDIAEEMGISLTDHGGKRFIWPITARYDWEIRHTDESAPTSQYRPGQKEEYQIIEHIALSSAWTVGLVCAAVFGIFGILIVPHIAPAVVAFLICLLFLAAPVAYRSPLGIYVRRLRTEGVPTTLDFTTYKTTYVAPVRVAVVAGIVALLDILILPVTFSRTDIQPAADIFLFTFQLIAVIVALYIRSYENRATGVRSFPFDIVNRIPLTTPELSGGYASLVLLSALVPFVVSQSYQMYAVFHYFYAIRAKVYLDLSILLLTLAILSFLLWSFMINRVFVYHRTLETLQERSSRRRLIVTGLLPICGSYLLGSVLYLYINRFQSVLINPILKGNIYAVTDNMFAIAILLAFVLPGSYFLFGILYQTVRHTVYVASKLLRSEPIGTTDRVDAQLRLHPESNNQAATALTLGVREYVIVSEALWGNSDLSSTEKQAIIEHEEAHLAKGDALLSMLVPYIATFGLIGQNILYALSNFRERELKADDYVSNPAALRSALKTIGSDKNWMADPGPNAMPSATWGSAGGVRERFMGLFFGSFALKQAHPSIRIRRERLKARMEGEIATKDD